MKLIIYGFTRQIFYPPTNQMQSWEGVAEDEAAYEFVRLKQDDLLRQLDLINVYIPPR